MAMSANGHVTLLMSQFVSERGFVQALLPRLSEQPSDGERACQWIVRGLFGHQKAQTYPIVYEQAVAGVHDGGLSRDPLGEDADTPRPIDHAATRHREWEELYYAASFDRPRKPKSH